MGIFDIFSSREKQIEKLDESLNSIGAVSRGELQWEYAAERHTFELSIAVHQTLRDLSTSQPLEGLRIVCEIQEGVETKFFKTRYKPFSVQGMVRVTSGNSKYDKSVCVYARHEAEAKALITDPAFQDVSLQILDKYPSFEIADNKLIFFVLLSIIKKTPEDLKSLIVALGRVADSLRY